MRSFLLGGGMYARAFPTGTLMVFQQTSAPPGWTKQTTHDDKSLRVVTGSASSGGATAFSSVFGSGKTAGATTLTTSHLPASGLSIPSLSVTGTLPTTSASGTPGANDVGQELSDVSNGTAPVTGSTGTGTTGNMGTGGSHNHTLSLDLHYVDIIIAAKT
jgi:hypothetical protein